MFDEKYYSSIHPYLPEDAKQILAAEIPKIQASIAADVDKFGKELAESVKREFEAHQKESQSALDGLRVAVKALAQVKGAALSKAIDDLSGSIDAHEKLWRGLGSSLQASVLTAVRATGLPL